MDSAERANLSQQEFEALKDSDLSVLITPYIIIGLVILAMFLLIRFTRMPKNADQSHSIDFFPTLKRISPFLTIEKSYRSILLCRCTIMCWTFIIQYGTRIFMAQGMDEISAEVISQNINCSNDHFLCKPIYLYFHTQIFESG